MSQRGRLGRRGAAGRRRTGPADTMVHTKDIEGARRRSHEPTAVRPELGLGWPESAHGWTGTTCRAASLDCSGWSEERDAGRARLDRVEGGDSRRTGPSRTTTQDVPLEVGHASVPTDNGNGTIPQRFDTPFKERVESSKDRFPVLSYGDYIGYICSPL